MVSNTQKYVKKKAIVANPAKIPKTEYDPMASDRGCKYLVTRNVEDQAMQVMMAAAKDLIFAGKISEIILQGIEANPVENTMR